MTNPRAKFMSELKSLCRDFEKQVDEVEKETRVTLNHIRVSLMQLFDAVRCTDIICDR